MTGPRLPMLNRTRIVVGLILLAVGMAVFGFGTWYVIQTLDRYDRILEACSVVDCSVAYQQYDIGLGVEGFGALLAVVGFVVVLLDLFRKNPAAAPQPPST